MSRTRRMLCIFYGLVALAALVATWGQNLAYFIDGDATDGLLQFTADTRVNPASRSIMVDIGLVLLAATVFMVVEARKLAVRFVWAYVALGFAIAISVTFPLFMIAREMRLARVESVDTGVRLTAGDVVGLAVTTGLVAYLSWFVLG